VRHTATPLSTWPFWRSWQSSAVTFAVDLTARLPSIDRLVGDPDEMAFTFLGRSIVVTGLDGGALVASGWVRFHCGGFDSEFEAEQFALELRDRLRLAAVRGKFGIAIDDRVERAHTVLHVDPTTGEPRSARSIVDGIQTYEETSADMVVSAMPVSIERQYGPDLMAEHLEAVAPLARPSGHERLALACDLVGGVDFESTVRARFIRLVTALEALAGERPDHAANLVALVDHWSGEATAVDRATIDGGELDSFIGQLRDLRKVSIKIALRKLVARHAPSQEAGESNERFVGECYDKRSLMLHEGVDVDVADQVARLRVIVENVLLAVASVAG
jgi:hypothetical protein